MKTITSCEVCDAPTLRPILDLGPQPLADDLVPIGSDEVPQSYPLQLAFCPRCITVHQQAQVEKQLLFPKTYHYRAAMTQDVLNGMRELVERAREVVGDLAGKQVLDIGCNDGSLLAIFGEFGANTAGIEPTGAAADAEGRVDHVLNMFFDSAAVDRYLELCPKPDIITFTNVFAHIEDLNGLLANLQRLMKPDTKLIVENHYLGAVIDRFQFDTFYHEHPRTYSCRSFEFIAEKLGRNIEGVEFPPRYMGNIRVVIGDGAAVASPVDETGFEARLIEMQQRVAEAKTRVHAQLQALAHKHGPLPAKAFPARASILIHTMGLDASIVDAVYERSGSPKVGHYVPGTRIEIRDEAEFLDDRIDAPVLVNLAWHIHAEIERYMRAKGYTGEIVPIFE